MLAGNSYPGYTDWAITMLLRWAAEDPVSQKEIDRNNAVYGIQGNRNPYVDFPGLEQYVWGTKKSTAVDLNNYDGSSQGGGTEQRPTAPVFSPEGGEVAAGSQITITAVGNYTIYYRINDGELQSGTSPVTLTVTADMTVTAFCTNSAGDSPTATATYTVAETPEPVTGDGVFALITGSDQLEAGHNYLIVWESGPRAMAGANGKVRSYIDVLLTDHTLDLSTLAEQPTLLQLGETADGYYTFYIADENAYLALSSDANNLGTEASANVQGAQWSVTFEGSNAVIANRQYSDRAIYFNSSSPRFATYKSTSKQRPVQLYKEQDTETGAGRLPMSNGGRSMEIYTLDGRRLAPGTPLRPGIYIVGGRKVVVR